MMWPETLWSSCNKQVYLWLSKYVRTLSWQVQFIACTLFLLQMPAPTLVQVPRGQVVSYPLLLALHTHQWYLEPGLDWESHLLSPAESIWAASACEQLSEPPEERRCFGASCTARRPAELPRGTPQLGGDVPSLRKERPAHLPDSRAWGGPRHFSNHSWQLPNCFLWTLSFNTLRAISPSGMWSYSWDKAFSCWSSSSPACTVTIDREHYTSLEACSCSCGAVQLLLPSL